MSHMTHKSHVKFICFNASMLNEFVDRLIIIIILIIIILQGALIDQRAVAAGKNSSGSPTLLLEWSFRVDFQPIIPCGVELVRHSNCFGLAPTLLPPLSQFCIDGI